MPRPSPRPYECVRKAWHSDRHQPIRGSLIQEILRSNPTSQNIHIGRLSMYTSNLICVVCLFTVVNEVHSSTTKKNKEWQEKLPVAVLKAEEIIYSKANSEVEFWRWVSRQWTSGEEGERRWNFGDRVKIVICSNWVKRECY